MGAVLPLGDLPPGAVVQRAGFFTHARALRGVDATTLEDRLGYRRGRFRDGWTLLLMLDLPEAHEFEVAGYTHFSGGVQQGHLDAPPDPRTSEQRLRDEGYDLPRIKRGLIERVFSVTPGDVMRLAKAAPVAGELGDGEQEYPPGRGVPQWTLKREHPRRFRVAAQIGPGMRYEGDYT